MSKRFFTEEEVGNLVYNHSVSETEIYENRWSMLTDSIVENDGKYYRVQWDRGLTEMQENIFYEGDYPEVEKVSELSCHMTEKWVDVGEDDSRNNSREYDYEPDIHSLRELGVDGKIIEILDAVTEEDIAGVKNVLDSLNGLMSVDLFPRLESRHAAAMEFLDELSTIKKLLTDS